MKYALMIMMFLVFTGCARKPYVDFKLQFEKIKEDCSGIEKAFNMKSNINGERYQFQRCLDEDFSKDKFNAIRQGDTVILRFARTGAKQFLYKVIVDVDSYPRYNFLTIDGETFPVIPAGN